MHTVANDLDKPSDTLNLDFPRSSTADKIMYILLPAGEKTANGDECWLSNQNQWVPISNPEFVVTDRVPVRRRVTPACVLPPPSQLLRLMSQQAQLDADATACKACAPKLVKLSSMLGQCAEFVENLGKDCPEGEE